MHLILVDNPPHHPQGDFSLDTDGLVLDHPGLTFSGIGLYEPQVFYDLKSQMTQPRHALAPVIRQYIKQQQVSGEYYSGRWWDIGTPQRLTELDHMLREEFA